MKSNLIIKEDIREEGLDIVAMGDYNLTSKDLFREATRETE